MRLEKRFVYTNTGVVTINLPAATVGDSACFFDGHDSANAMTLNPNSADNFLVVLTSTLTATTANKDLSTGADDGDMICIIAYDDDTWVVYDYKGTLGIEA